MFVVTGREVIFSLETASDYVKDEKASFYGFKCQIIGYEWGAKPEEVTLFFLEQTYQFGPFANNLAPFGYKSDSPVQELLSLAISKLKILPHLLNVLLSVVLRVLSQINSPINENNNVYLLIHFLTV